ncbi:LysR family transcriptional regulator [Rhodococcus artemisiae]|uniref:LysR family transcriptional regulator n=1 Tax=Rhodococcus artemisiae TaxID=714159 RepID=A0ABU7L6H4_9NOCA|nr:LysR family transcriptional regulator [Rhodococcus artemisiae]MEE2056909.1 LysR family transcriptional regulator [Rhodococcus artemisiae]
MDTHRLGYFLRIAEEGSMTQAASVLGVAQPALSRQLRLLEEDLGVKLFRRTPRGMELTDDGEQLRANTAGPLRQLELALQYAGSPMAHIERGLRLGLTETVAATLASPLLGSLSAAFPKVSFSVTVSPSEKLVEDMLKENLDTAIINSIPDDRLFYSELLVEDLVVVGGPASDLHPIRAIKFAELVNYPLVLPISPVGIGTTLTNTALRLEITLRSRFATDSLQVSKELIESGQAYGILPLSACRSEVRSGRLRYAPLNGPVLSHRVGMAATAQHKLPRGFSIKVGLIIREEFARLTKSSA